MVLQWFWLGANSKTMVLLKNLPELLNLNSNEQFYNIICDSSGKLYKKKINLDGTGFINDTAKQPGSNDFLDINEQLVNFD